MRILVVCQHYWPEPYPLEDTCEELVRRGHEVHVVTGIPNYPMGYIYDEYKNRKNRRQEHNGVRITRTWTIGRRKNVVFRILNYFSFAFSSTLFVRSMQEEYDVVYTNQTSPVMMVQAAMSYAKKWNKRVVLYCMDLWPASLAAGGISEDSVIYKLFGKISEKLYKKADLILITSSMFRDYFKKQFKINDEKIKYHPQYADNIFGRLPMRVEDGSINLMFAGNIGIVQSIPTILKAAQILSYRTDIKWHIVGDGSELENNRQLARQLGLSQVIFHGRKQLQEMPEYYNMADAMLVTLTSDPIISLTLPGKVQTYMAAGKPILAAADGEIQNTLEMAGCGFYTGAENSEGLAQIVLKFVSCKEKCKLGEKARAYYEENFTRELFMERLEQELKNACINK